MKKFLTGAALCAAVLASAQIDFSSTRLGVTLGGTYSRVTNAHNPSGPLYGFTGGLLALIPVDSNDQFYLQPGLEYLQAGETGKDKDAKNAPGYNAKYANNYLSIPVYFKAYFSEAESEFFGFAGPRFNVLVSQNVSGDAPARYTVEGDGTGVNGKASSFNFAASLGVGFSLRRQLEISARYDLGLSNTYKGLMAESGADPNITKKKSEQVVSIGLSYIFK